MKTLYTIAMILISLFFRLGTQAQEKLRVEFDKKEILIGDPATLTLSFMGDKTMQILWPDLKDTLVDKVEILEKSGIDTVYSDDRKSFTLKQAIKVTSFDSGYYAIPPVSLTWTVKGDTTVFRELSQAMLLSVKTVPVDTTKSIHDIKPVISAPYTFREALPWILLILALLAVVYFGIMYLKKGKKALPVIKLPEKPKIPPHQLALDALEELHRKKLWQAGLIKQYHTELTDIVRHYIAARFNIPAVEMTTDEIMDSVEHTPVSKSAREKLRHILILSDLVKFAKNEPLATENEQSFLAALEFVKDTINIIEDNLANPERQVEKAGDSGEKGVTEGNSNKSEE